MTDYIFGEVKVEVLDEWKMTVTNIEGRKIVASHEEQPGQASTAAEYGISVHRMNTEHDLAHCILAHLLGLPHSPTLAAVAKGQTWPDWWREEKAVLALQGYAEAAGVSLRDVAERLQQEAPCPKE